MLGLLWSGLAGGLHDPVNHDMFSCFWVGLLCLLHPLALLLFFFLGLRLYSGHGVKRYTPRQVRQTCPFFIIETMDLRHIPQHMRAERRAGYFASPTRWSSIRVFRAILIIWSRSLQSRGFGYLPDQGIHGIEPTPTKHCITTNKQCLNFPMLLPRVSANKHQYTIVAGAVRR